MKFSIVVPNFNGGAHIGACLDSIIAQRCAGVDVEIIVMAAASIDDSCAQIAARGAHIQHFVSEKDGGQSDALGKGFARSDGEIMAWLCSDDMYLPGALRKVRRYFEDHPDVDLVYGDMCWMDVEGRVLRTQREIDFDEQIFLWTYNYIPQPATFWRRSLWTRSAGLDESLVCAMDRELWLQFMRAGARICHTPDYLAAMRSYPEQKTRRLRRQSAIEDLQARIAFLGRPVEGAELVTKGSWHRLRRIAKRLRLGAYWAPIPSFVGARGTMVAR
jgi:glycosyltransferase involved in cell wall biosynthesis